MPKHYGKPQNMGGTYSDENCKKDPTCPYGDGVTKEGLTKDVGKGKNGK